MRSLTAIMIVVFLPSAACCAESQSSLSLASSLIKMFGALSVVIGIIYLFTYLSRNFLKGHSGFGGVHSHIRVIETRHLSPKKSLMLVEVAGEYMLLSNCSDGISLIKQVDMIEEIEVIEVIGATNAKLKESFQQKFDSFMGRFQPQAVRKLT